MSKLLVTGGAGFVGSHLVKKLLHLGHTVIALDNLYTGALENIADMQDHPNFSCIKHDICLPLFVEVDQIYNLASPASPIHYQRDPVQTTKTNVVGTLNMLELARNNEARIVQASTSEVYGDPLMHPQEESYCGNVNPVGPRACYDEGKRCAETLFFDYHRQYRTDIGIARIFNTYGPNMHADDGRVVSNFIVQALKGEPITLFGTGEQTRSFCYVDDLVDGLIKLMESGEVGPINLGNPVEFSMQELAHLICELIGSTSPVEYRPLPQDDPQKRKPHIARAKELLHWEPHIPLKEGLEKTIAYFAERVS